ncbi:hypothetical protein H8356DRAFT_1437952 [Neocallimastix lanati (nom. inval.)]|nr:hypothetical protein H8356DRAFT_1437952 [Neocallimastix sp. JGI-2020a]
MLIEVFRLENIGFSPKSFPKNNNNNRNSNNNNRNNNNNNMETTENQKEEISKINKNVDASKFIEAITEFVPTFFSPGGMLLKESEKKNNGSVLETIIQSENFFADHPNSFLSDETKNT